ncbi:MAG: polysaccharide deacetylase family protein [Chitinivibrionales bacterium]|nr:polysaccharide deacetylase family protein [Chitinivibrionales bacterium]
MHWRIGTHKVAGDRSRRDISNEPQRRGRDRTHGRPQSTAGIRHRTPRSFVSSARRVILTRRSPLAALLPLLLSCTVFKWYASYPSDSPHYVLLTFDDGPNGHDSTTLRLLDVLEKHDVKAIFFLIGQNVEHFPAITAEIHRRGQVIGNHGWSSESLLFMSDERARESIDRCTAALRAALGDSSFSPRYFRPPLGLYRASTLRLAHERGMTTVCIDNYSYDAHTAPAEAHKLVRRLVRSTERRNGGLHVLHDGKDEWQVLEEQLRRAPDGHFNKRHIPEVVDELITQLKERGYRFPSLAGAPKGDLEASVRSHFGGLLR